VAQQTTGGRIALQRAYLDGLYPTSDDWQVISDMHVIEQMEKHGDDTSIARQVDHWIYFPSESLADDFIEWGRRG
jgi:Regulator of ribonuclease activity B